MPFTFLAWIAIEGRFSQADWEFNEYGPKGAEAVYAYGRVIQRANRAVAQIPADADLAIVRDAQASVWISAKRTGELDVILPASVDDLGDTGPKEQIFTAKNELMMFYQALAQQKLTLGDIDGFSKNALVCLEISQIGKYSDFESITNADLCVMTICRMIDRSYTAIEPNQKELLAEKLNSCFPDKRSFDRAASHYEALLVFEARKWDRSFDADVTRALFARAATTSDGSVQPRWSEEFDAKSVEGMNLIKGVRAIQTEERTSHMIEDALSLLLSAD